MEEEDEGPEAGSLSAGGRPTAHAQALHPDEIHAGEGRSRKRTKAGVYTSNVTFDSLASVFHLPSNQACEVLGVGLTIFKRLCRKFGLQRWPYRTLKKQGKLSKQGGLSQEDLELVIAVCRDPDAPALAAVQPHRVQQAQQQARRHGQRSGSGSGSHLSGPADSGGDAGDSKAASGCAPQGTQALLPLQPQQQQRQRQRPGSPAGGRRPHRRAKAAVAPLAWTDSQRAGFAGGMQLPDAALEAEATASQLQRWASEHLHASGVRVSPSSSGGADVLMSGQEDAGIAAFRRSGEAMPGAGAGAAGAPGSSAFGAALEAQLGSGSQSRLDLLLSAMRTENGGLQIRTSLPSQHLPPIWLPLTPPGAVAGAEQQQQQQQQQLADGGVIRPQPTRAMPSAGGGGDPMQLQRILVAPTALPAQQAQHARQAAADADLASPFCAPRARDGRQQMASMLKQLAQMFEHQAQVVAAAAAGQQAQQAQPSPQQYQQQAAAAAALLDPMQRLRQLPGTAGPHGFGAPVQPPQLPRPPMLTGLLGEAPNGLSPMDGSTNSGSFLSLGCNLGSGDLFPLGAIASAASLLPPPPPAAPGSSPPEYHSMEQMHSLMGKLLSGGGSLNVDGGSLGGAHSMSLSLGGSSSLGSLGSLSLSLPLPPQVVEQLMRETQLQHQHHQQQAQQAQQRAQQGRQA